MDDQTRSKISSEVNSGDVVLFMKGTPVFPQCGFSAAVVQVLNHLNVPFKGVNVLDDMAIREGIKEYSSWPTMSKANSSVAVTSSAKCLKRAN